MGMNEIMEMNGRERIMRILRGEPVDRIAVKLWGLALGQPLLHPSYKPVYDAAMAKVDLFGEASSYFDFITGARSSLYTTTRRPKSEEWTEAETLLHTPEGDLSSIDLVSNTGKPGYTITHFVKKAGDFRKILSIPYEPSPITLNRYNAIWKAVGERGIVMFEVDHAGYALQRLTGSELLAYFSVDERELLREILNVFAGRIYQHVRQVLDALRKEYGPCFEPVVGWVGPELLIPPLLSLNDFEELCFDVDKSMMDMIHDAGGRIWIHCHGKMSKVITRFADMGCDLLNPIEPPPMGDISLEDSFRKVGGRMALEGNIEIGEIMRAPESRIKELVEGAVETGAQHGRFVLCPSAGYMEVPEPTETYIRNLLIYVNFGMDCAKRYRCN
jgi:hypothetical protein